MHPAWLTSKVEVLVEAKGQKQWRLRLTDATNEVEDFIWFGKFLI